MNKKIIRLVVCFIIICCSLSVLASCTIDGPNGQAEKTGINYLVLGDSIAEAIIGVSPLEERDNFAYCSVVGQINGYTYHNRSISGKKTGGLLEYISSDVDTTAYTPITLIKQADIIQISIVGNNVLLENTSLLAMEMADGDTTRIDGFLKTAYDEFELIIDRLYELNPDVTILIQTIYNPMYAASTIISQEAKEYVVSKGHSFYEIGGYMLNRMNGVFYDYQREHPYKIHIVDVNSKFDAVKRNSTEDVDCLDRLIFPDCIHPSNEGHAYIATTTQEKLEELGFADHDTAMANYKALRIDQLKRLYKDTTVNVKQVTKQIKSATTYDQINKVFFDATYDVVPNY